MPEIDYRLGAHLPQNRPGGQAADPDQLPRQRRGTTPQMIGRFPDFDVLDPAILDTWDEATRKVVLGRLELTGRKLEFFTPEEELALRAFADTMLSQDREPRVPVAEMLDLKYSEGKLEGYQYEDVPDDRSLWREVLKGLDFTARGRYGRPFCELDLDARGAICGDLQQGVLQGGPWDAFNVERAYTVTMAAMVSEFYSHPWAWNEIGFGGPAYPRGYARFGPLGPVEAWEEPDTVSIDPVRDVETRHLP